MLEQSSFLEGPKASHLNFLSQLPVPSLFENAMSVPGGPVSRQHYSGVHMCLLGGYDACFPFRVLVWVC